MVKTRLQKLLRFVVVFYLQTTIFALSLFQAAAPFHSAQSEQNAGLEGRRQSYFSDASLADCLPGYNGENKTRAGIPVLRIKDIRFFGTVHIQNYLPLVLSQIESETIWWKIPSNKNNILLKLRI